jgi:electron transport complex protein RnfE
MNVAIERIKNGLFTENVIFVQVLAMCPTLAVTSSVMNGLGMGLASTVVLMGANFVISLLRNFIPDKVRIPAFIVVIAGFVTLLQFLLAGFVPALNKSLGIFIPLIVVNCVILGRAEAYASKNGPIASILMVLDKGLVYFSTRCYWIC